MTVLVSGLGETVAVLGGTVVVAVSVLGAAAVVVTVVVERVSSSWGWQPMKANRPPA